MDYQSDETYLKQVFNPLANVSRSFIKLLYQSIQFFLKKIWLFTVLIAIGIVGGYFLDKNEGDKVIKQELVIAPSSQSVSFIYDFIKMIPYRAGTEGNLESIGLKKDWIENLKSIKIEPITSLEDIYDYLHNDYQDRNFQYSIQDFSENELAREKFRYIYRFHKIEIKFRKQKEYNSKITKTLLDYIYSNEYFTKQVGKDVKQAGEFANTYRKSLKFVDAYLERVIKDTSESSKDEKVMVSTDEWETTMLAGLIEQKNRTIYALRQDERTLHQQNEVFTLVNDTSIITMPKKIYKRKMLLLPFGLCFVICLVFLAKHTYKWMEKVSQE